jgi:nitroimidazol reductase NimA-like FMN-containing flavoprotein (pyridoxamine 5'-phosphate oxidase superfamily)
MSTIQLPVRTDGPAGTATLQTDRTTVRRLPKRGQYDAATVHAILDEGLICHVGFTVAPPGAPDGAGRPVVIPTIHWRDGERLYFHGSVASRMLRNLRDGVEACVTVTLLDGLVLARSAFHHSMNYRSAVVFGLATEVTDRDEKYRALERLVEHVSPGRNEEGIRPPSEAEVKGTLILSMPIEEASAKIRTGGPIDDEEDYALPVWAGVLPLRMTAGEPVSDERNVAGVWASEAIRNYCR